MMSISVEELLERALKVTQEAEIHFSATEDTPVNFEASRLKQVLYRQNQAVALRIIKDGRIGFASATHLDNPEALVEAALETASLGAQAHFQLPEQSNFPTVVLYDPKVEAFSTDNMIDIGQRLTDGVRSHRAEVTCDAWVSKRVSTTRILNSRGLDVSYKKSFFNLGVEGLLLQGKDMLVVGEAESSSRLIIDPSPLVQETVRQLELGRNQVHPRTGHYPVIFAPRGVLSTLIYPLAMGFNGRQVLKGSSPLSGRLEEELFDPKLYMWDNPILDLWPGSRFCDDEGIPSSSRPLIEKGRVANFLYDLQTAALAGVSTSGNAGRGPGGLPYPSFSLLVLQEGDASFEDMVVDMKEGLIVEQIIGSQGNLLGGNFGGNVLLGYWVEKGEVTGRVKDTMVAGNVYDILRRVVALGAEGVWAGGFLKTPYIYCPTIGVSAKS